MQKEYVILNHSDRVPVLISINSLDYPALLQAGYSVVFQGNKKECQEVMMEQE